MRYLFYVYFSYSVCAEKIHTACNDMATLFPGVSVCTHIFKSVPKCRMSSDLSMNVMMAIKVDRKHDITLFCYSVSV